jgi:ribosomal protein S18 acetylase RimI-like enzyme
MSPKLRRGQRSDAGFLAWVMLAASRGHVQRGVWDLIVGGNDQECLDYLERLSLADPHSLCSCENFVIAEVDGHPAAALCGFAFADGGWGTVAQAMTNVQRDLGWTEADLAASGQRSAPVYKNFGPNTGADWCVELVATRPEYRRRGLVDLLMREAIQQGVDRGCKLAQITILIGNDAAQKAYEKVGFRVHDERGTPEFQAAIGAPGFRRFLRPL